MKPLPALFAAIAAAFLLSATRSDAATGTIRASVNNFLPICPGDTFTVTLRISGYTNPVGIDAYQFKITYPAALFAFTGPIDHGLSAPAADPQWLSLPSQESSAAGYAPTGSDNSSVPGVIIIDYADLGFSDPEGGTTAASGLLVSFKMTALAAGTGTFTPAAPPGGVTFFDVDLNPAGSPLFAGTSVTVNTPITAWRQANFGTTSNTGNAADTADPDRDGLDNRTEFGFGLNPNLADRSLLPQAQISGGTIRVQFFQPAVCGVTYGAEYSTSLTAGTWTAIPDFGTPPLHSFSVPVSGKNRLFFRMTVAVP